jgi:hypothetical protein
MTWKTMLREEIAAFWSGRGGESGRIGTSWPFENRSQYAILGLFLTPIYRPAGQFALEADGEFSDAGWRRRIEVRLAET